MESATAPDISIHASRRRKIEMTKLQNAVSFRSFKGRKAELSGGDSTGHWVNGEVVVSHLSWLKRKEVKSVRCKVNSKYKTPYGQIFTVSGTILRRRHRSARDTCAATLGTMLLPRRGRRF
jgi:hypothetical protein